MHEKRRFAVMVAVSILFLSGCPSPNDDKEEEKGPLSAIDIDASAIYYDEYDTTGLNVSVWNEGYTSPVEDAVVMVNGTTLPYSATIQSYADEIDEIVPGSDIAFSIACNGETYEKTLKLPSRITITGWDNETGFDATKDNVVSWTLDGDAPERISLLIGDDDWIDIKGNLLSYTIPAGTFTGQEAYAYVGIRAVNYIDDGRKHFIAFTGDEGFRSY